MNPVSLKWTVSIDVSAGLWWEKENNYDNIACAVCEGLNKDDVSPFKQIVVNGTESPGYGE